MSVDSQELTRTDDELIALTAAGDTEAFTSFVARHREAIHRYLYALLHSAADAEDLLQETFLAAWRNAASFRHESSPRNWLYAIARHAAFHHRQHLAHYPDCGRPIEELGLAAGWGTLSPEQFTLNHERSAALARAMASLSPADREILHLRDVVGLDGDAAARLLQLPLPTMKTRLHRARLRLMAALKDLIS